MDEPRPREPMKLCGAPFTLEDAEPAEDSDVIYCGLPFGHRPPHIGLVWWFDEPAGDGA